MAITSRTYDLVQMTACAPPQGAAVRAAANAGGRGSRMAHGSGRDGDRTRRRGGVGANGSRRRAVDRNLHCRAGRLPRIRRRGGRGQFDVVVRRRQRGQTDRLASSRSARRLPLVLGRRAAASLRRRRRARRRFGFGGPNAVGGPTPCRIYGCVGRGGGALSHDGSLGGFLGAHHQARRRMGLPYRQPDRPPRAAHDRAAMVDRDDLPWPEAFSHRHDGKLLVRAKDRAGLFAQERADKLRLRFQERAGGREAGRQQRTDLAGTQRRQSRRTGCSGSRRRGDRRRRRADRGRYISGRLRGAGNGWRKRDERIGARRHMGFASRSRTGRDRNVRFLPGGPSTRRRRRGRHGRRARRRLVRGRRRRGRRGAHGPVDVPVGEAYCDDYRQYQQRGLQGICRLLSVHLPISPFPNS
jgi:hypothetical protein